MRRLFTFTSGMFGTWASHAHRRDGRSNCAPPTHFPPSSTGRPPRNIPPLCSRYRKPPHRDAALLLLLLSLPPPRSAHLCARLQPLVHLVDPILGLDHVGRVSPVEGSERGRVERVVGRVGHGERLPGRSSCARREFNIQRARRRTWRGAWKVEVVRGVEEGEVGVPDEEEKG